MITKDEATVISWLGGGWAVNLWAHYIEPGLQALLLIITVIGAAIVVWNRLVENQIKREELRKLQNGD